MEEEINERKAVIRSCVWSKLEESPDALKDYPPSCLEKIPNFQGCERAAKKVSQLAEFRRSQVIKVNPSLAQMHLRYLILKHEKTLLVPSPALAPQKSLGSAEECFFYKIDGSNLKKHHDMHRAASKAGAVKFGQPLLLDWTCVPKIDLVVVASVAVSTNGVRLGKGLGYAEMEWGILTELGVVNEKTKVLTKVHEDQICDLSEDLMTEHDLPVDIIVTPKRIINVRKKLKKPTCGILWEKVTPEKLERLPVLRLLKQRQNELLSSTV